MEINAVSKEKVFYSFYTLNSIKKGMEYRAKSNRKRKKKKIKINKWSLKKKRSET